MAAGAIQGPDFLLLHGSPALSSVLSRPTQPLAAIADGFLSEEHAVRLSKTSYPVETGGSLVDHAVIQPRTLKLAGWVSDLLAPEGRRGSPSRGIDAWSQLTGLIKSREPFLVVTLLGVYPSMLITSLKAPVDRTTGRALRFEMELEEVQFRALERGQRPPPVRIGPAEDRSEEVDGGLVNAPSIPPEHVVVEINDLQEPEESEDGPSIGGRIAGGFKAIGRFFRIG